MIVVLTTIPVDSDCRETAMAYITNLVEHSESEGTVRYHAVEDVTEPNLIRFFEVYDDTDAVETHTKSEPYRQFTKVLPEFISGTIETLQFETDDLSVVEFTATDAVDTLN